MNDIYSLLSEKKYPGRGIALGKSADGKNAVAAYFIMGRSANSKNRVFVSDGAVISTKAHDEKLLTDPSLVIYNAIIPLGERLIVTNGKQTDTVCEFLRQGKTLSEALDLWSFEPDPPILTPRISGVLSVEGGDVGGVLSILKSTRGSDIALQKQIFEYPRIPSGEGRFVSTYVCDGDPPPSFEGEPFHINIPDDINEFSRGLWDSLDGEYKVSLAVRYIHLKNKTVKTLIINKNK